MGDAVTADVIRQVDLDRVPKVFQKADFPAGDLHFGDLPHGIELNFYFLKTGAAVVALAFGIAVDNDF